MSENDSSVPQSRGPAEHSVRDQIVVAAEAHFRHYGYEKTTVSDLAKAIGFSKAYIYKFFDSKQAIGEAICVKTLDTLMIMVDAAVADAPTASAKLRQLFRTLVDMGVGLFFKERKLYDIAAHSAGEGWPSARAYCERVRWMLEGIIREGRETGEFECQTPLDETVRAVELVMLPYVNPLLLQFNLDLVDEAPTQLSDLILRSLAPDA